MKKETNTSSSGVGATLWVVYNYYPDDWIDKFMRYMKKWDLNSTGWFKSK